MRNEYGGNSLYSSNRNTAEGELPYADRQPQRKVTISNTYARTQNSTACELAKRPKSYGTEEGSDFESVQRDWKPQSYDLDRITKPVCYEKHETAAMRMAMAVRTLSGSIRQSPMSHTHTYIHMSMSMRAYMYAYTRRYVGSRPTSFVVLTEHCARNQKDITARNLTW